MWLFHRRREGQEVSPGLNVTIDITGIDVIFLWPLRVVLPGDRTIRVKIRFRRYLRPHFVFRINTFNIDAICNNCGSWIAKEAKNCPLCLSYKDGRTLEEVNGR